MPPLVRRSRRGLSLAAVLGVTLFMVVIAGCGASESDTAPAATVQQLLELRSQNSTDAAAYSRHVEETSVVEALVADSAARTPGEAPTPEWKDPRVTDRDGSKATVRVEWIADKDFEGWPTATIFKVERKDGRWVVVDASEAKAADE